MSNTQAKVAIEKSEYPERFCPARRCLWRTAKLNHATGEREGGGYCPRHQPVKTHMALEEALQIVREQKAGRAGVSWTDTPLTKSTLCVAVEMVAEKIVLPSTWQLKAPAPNEPKLKITVMDWIRNGFRFPAGRG